MPDPAIRYPVQCSIPRLGRSPGAGNGHPLQYSCLQNPMDRGAWQAIQSMGLKELDMTEQLTYTWVKCIKD